MRRYVKVLAAGSLVGFQGMPGYLTAAVGQTSQLPPVTISGRSSGSANGGSACWPNCTAYSGGGGGSSSGSQSFPENEATVKLPAPPPAPKSDEQRQREREQCNTDRAWKMSVFQTGISGMVQACAARYAANNIFTTVELIKNLLGTSCGQEIARQTDTAARQFDAEHAQCMAKANKP